MNSISKNTSIISEARDILEQLATTINQLNTEEYSKKISLLSNSTIGEHTRHIIELFQQLLSGYQHGVINYDERKRDIKIQENIDFATESIVNITQELEKDNKKLYLITGYNNQKITIESNYFRELMYNIEHCIHHQAINKIAFFYLNKTEIDENIGVAKSTMAHRKTLVM